ncbi:uncharacterized protein LOC129774158 [Toxorhynchites rutilus septentrionalis]|uniref:uncharacterized protein LOC129774158 n=1 Tax=Toxorhynchites rutilus septentrionalis TaxID=329112 RepID=UPI0024790B93|nr:uncharacterized protein LOC129774158 [Toxorhynchites rutilus septentrionalis]
MIFKKRTLVIQGKILLQDVWRARLDWDDRIPEDLFVRWKQWLQVLKELDNVRITRCYFPGYDPACYDDLELHIFVDGSEQAYSAAAYFRVRDQGQIRCALVSSKTKVAPLQLTSVPRLELQAAVIGARLRKTIEDGHSVRVKSTYFWSDSSTVISWITSDTRRYRQYVAFRVNEILSLSKTDEWRWLGSKINVADEATKWGKGPNCKPDSRWMCGPAFIYQEENDWPTNKVTTASRAEEELRAAYVCSHFISVPLVDVSRFSKYERLLRSMAYVYRFVGKLLQRIEKQPKNGEVNVTSEELLRAERSLWRLAQSESYPDEIATLNQNARVGPEKQKALERSSSIATLSPLLDEYGILRMDSRISTADYLTYDTRYPIILPRKHPVTNLLLDWYHRKFRHGNNETIVNEVRQRFRIPQLRTQVRAAEYRCQWCRVYKTKPESPKMGPHLLCRLTPFLRPFTFVGIDYFGPYFVTVGRASVKRWVAVFTCLTVRAIHLELVYSLTTDSCKKAIRRFIARRGAPQEIYTDNGTNFVGASRELESQIREISITMSSTFTDANTKWRFNPPAAPHMGGCWERMVRSVKTALGEMPTLRKLDDESFMTLLSEAEHMVNSRPLTYLPLDNREKESLTPNHFLLLNSSGFRQLVKDPVDAKKAVGESWNMIQHMLDQFWRRWIMEYLPVISRRTKWFQDAPTVKENALVLIVDERVRNQWIRGRVIRTYPGKDGVVRRADVETSGGIMQRPVCKLAVLIVHGEDGVEAGGHEGDAVEEEIGRDGDLESCSELHEGEDVAVKHSAQRPLVQP